MSASRFWSGDWVLVSGVFWASIIALSRATSAKALASPCVSGTMVSLLFEFEGPATVAGSPLGAIAGGRWGSWFLFWFLVLVLGLPS